jgi:hypothetical protein
MQKQYEMNKQNYISLILDDARSAYRSKLKDTFNYADVRPEKSSYPVSEMYKQLDQRLHAVENSNLELNTNKNTKQENYAVTYGEIKYDGAMFLLKFIEDNGIEFFADIGCGCCKLPILMSSAKSIKLSYGVEIVEARIKKGFKILEQMSNFLNDNFGSKFNFTNKITLIEQDMFNIDFKKLTEGKKSLVFISNLCFGEKITTQLYDKLTKELPPGSFIVSSSAPSTENINKFKLVRYDNDKYNVKNGKRNVPMSWDSTSNVNIFITS